jgi:hypothetical protein
MIARPSRANREEALWLAYWNADGVRGRELEPDRFLSDHGVDICHLNETHLESHRDQRFAKYVCHWADRPARSGGTVILVLCHRHTPDVEKQVI